ncbi:MAG: peptidoglycan-binding domain-containing protein, partial [Clostridia bacterium]|nr:peptidoglycan-binding domain-containing protein [Clostridia bacterium]
MKRFSAIIAIVLMLFGSCLAAEYEPHAGEKANLADTTAVYLTINSEPYDELGSGTTVDVVAIEGEWARISYIDTLLYVPVSSLTATEEALEDLISISSAGREFYLVRECDFHCEQTGLDIRFHAGESVIMLEADSERARVLLSGITGYFPLDALAVSPDFNYQLGLSGDSIEPMQERLEELGYFDGVPNGVLDIDTVDAVLRFRYQSGMSDEFELLGDFRDVLYGEDAPEDPIRILSLQLTDAGAAVKRLQNRLIAKGYLVDTPTGYYDNTTMQAVAAFQSVERLEQTGIANTETMSALFSSRARVMPRNLMPVTRDTTIYLPGGVINSDWWTGDIQSAFEIGMVATVTDVETGLTWREQRRGGYNHADVQPLTVQDTAIFLAAVGGEWTWERRAIWVDIGSARYAASMNCMPHGGGEILDNNFDGHHCIHFLNSRTHGTNSLDARHQTCVSIAAGLLPIEMMYPEQAE